MFTSIITQYGSAGGMEMGTMLAVYGVVFVIALAISALICFLVYRLFDAIPAQHRTMEPGMVWLLMIPLFNLFWNFKVFLGLADSFANAFEAAGQPLTESQSGRTMGLWYSILVLCSIIPCLGSLTTLVGLVLLILILVKGHELKNRLASLPKDGEADGYEDRWPS